jgi:hypothetical protein
MVRFSRDHDAFFADLDAPDGREEGDGGLV